MIDRFLQDRFLSVLLQKINRSHRLVVRDCFNEIFPQSSPLDADETCTGKNPRFVSLKCEVD